MAGRTVLRNCVGLFMGLLSCHHSMTAGILMREGSTLTTFTDLAKEVTLLVITGRTDSLW